MRGRPCAGMPRHLRDAPSCVIHPRCIYELAFQSLACSLCTAGRRGWAGLVSSRGGNNARRARFAALQRRGFCPFAALFFWRLISTVSDL